MADINEQKALDAGAVALIAAYDDDPTTYGTAERMAKTIALMGLPKKMHKDSPFWTDPQGTVPSQAYWG